MNSNFTVIYDACVLYPAPLRDFLMHLALTDLFRACWTNTIHDEWIRNVLRESWRLLSDDGAIFMNHKPRIQKGQLWTPLDLDPGLPVRQIVIWDRGSGFNFNSSFFTPRHEWIVIYAKPNFRLTQDKRPWDV